MKISRWANICHEHNGPSEMKAEKRSIKFNKWIDTPWLSEWKTTVECDAKTLIKFFVSTKVLLTRRPTHLSLALGVCVCVSVPRPNVFIYHMLNIIITFRIKLNSCWAYFFMGEFTVASGACNQLAWKRWKKKHNMIKRWLRFGENGIRNDGWNHDFRSF